MSFLQHIVVLLIYSFSNLTLQFAYFPGFKMNTNGGADAPTFGQYCYDYADTRRSEVSSDYLALLGAYTFQGRMAAETAHFCGIFDGTNTMFPDVFSKSVV